MSEKDEDQESNRELMRQYWQADPWNNFCHVMGRIKDTIHLMRLLFWFGRIVWAVFSSIAWNPRPLRSRSQSKAAGFTRVFSETLAQPTYWRKIPATALCNALDVAALDLAPTTKRDGRGSQLSPSPAVFSASAPWRRRSNVTGVHMAKLSATIVGPVLWLTAVLLLSVPAAIADMVVF